MRKFIKGSVLKAALMILAICGPGGRVSAQMLINGAGATFPNPIYQKWFFEYRKVDPAIAFNYQPIGSGGGQNQITAQTVDFGASDGPMSDESLAKAPGKILHIPTVAGAVVLTYNLPGAPKLKLDGPVLADIFLGKITKWNDRQIADLNSGTKLPDLNIKVVHRSDGSGTTYIFTDYLSEVSKGWAEGPKKGTAVNWPTGMGAKGSDGIVGQVKLTPGAIGYAELVFAVQNKLPTADIKNAKGEFVSPSVEAVTKAMANAKIPDDFRFSMVNAPGEGAYPISGATWLLVYEQQKDAAKGRKIAEFLEWALTKGEGMTSALDYAPLPDALQKRVLERIKTIKY